MADQTASWILRLKDEMSGAADTAAKALKRLDQQLQADTRELQAMQKAMANLQKGSVVNVEQFRKLKAAIDAKKDSIAKAQGEYVALGGNFTGTASKARGLEARLAALSKNAKEMPGPIGSLVAQFGRLKELVGGGLIAGGILAIATAVAALTVATVAGVRALYQYGVAQADARRSELLRLEGLTKLRFLFQRVPGNAKEMQQAIDLVAAKTPVARDQVAKYSEQLYRMGLRGSALTKTLEGVAIKSSVQGEAAATAFGSWAAGAALTGRSVDKLVDNVKARLGGVAAKQMQSLTVQAQKQKEAFDSLFSGLELDDYLAKWKGVNDLLTQATASGRALKFMTQALLQPLIDASANGAPIVKRFFQGMIIAALQLTIVLLQVRQWWRKTFGTPEQKKAMDDGAKWVLAGKVALGALVTGLGIASVAVVGLSLKLTGWLIPALIKSTFAMLRFSLTGITGAVRGSIAFALSLGRMAASALAAVPALWAAVVPMLPFIAAAIGVGAAIYQLIKYWDDLKIAFEQVDWLQMGKDMLQGIIDGLGLQPLIDHMKSLANGALDAFKETLGITSPSKVFMKAGLAIPEGVAAGVDKGSPAAQAAADSMVKAPPPAAADTVDVPRLGTPSASGGALPGAGPAVAARRGDVKIEIGQVVVHASSSEPKTMALDFRRELESVLEGLALELGGRVTGAT